MNILGLVILVLALVISGSISIYSDQLRSNRKYLRAYNSLLTSYIILIVGILFYAIMQLKI